MERSSITGSFIRIGDRMKMSIDLNQLNQEQRNALARVLMNDTQPLPIAKPEKEKKHTKGQKVVEKVKAMHIGEFADLGEVIKEMDMNPLTTIAYLFRLAQQGYISIRIAKIDALPEDVAESMCHYGGKKKNGTFKHLNSFKKMFSY